MPGHPIVIDTGASISVTSNAREFIKGISKSNIQNLKGLKDSTKVNSMSTVQWNIHDVNNKVKK
jgi:hypothetical protein